MLRIYHPGFITSVYTFASSSLFLLAFSQAAFGASSLKRIEIENSATSHMNDHSEVIVVSFKQNNVCDRVKEQLPAIEKNLDRTIKMLQPLVESANKYVEDNTGISSDEIALWIQRAIEKTPRIVAAFLEDREITVKYYSTHSPLPFVVTENCEIEPNLSRRISAPGGYFLIKYEPK